MFMMTTGRRSVRDKSLTYFDEIMEGLERKVLAAIQMVPVAGPGRRR